MKVTEQRYTYHTLKVRPVEGTLRTVAGGKCVDVRIDDPRSTVTYATVNVANVIDRQGRPLSY